MPFLPIFVDLWKICAIFKKEKEMETEPTVLMQIFEIVFGCIFYIVGVVGFLFFLYLIDYIFTNTKCRCGGKFIQM